MAVLSSLLYCLFHWWNNVIYKIFMKLINDIALWISWLLTKISLIWSLRHTSNLDTQYHDRRYKKNSNNCLSSANHNFHAFTVNIYEIYNLCNHWYLWLKKYLKWTNIILTNNLTVFVLISFYQNVGCESCVFDECLSV